MKTLIRDCRRFILSYRYILEKAPLQTYASAILFSPRNSPLRQAFLTETAPWVENFISPDEEWGPCLQTLEGHIDSVNIVVFSPDGELAASGSDDNTVRLWNTKTGESRGVLEGHWRSVRTVVFSPNGELIASGSDDDTVRLWDIKTGETRGMLRGHSRSITTVVFSPDGELIVSGSGDRTLRLWDTKTGESRGTLEGHSD